MEKDGARRKRERTHLRYVWIDYRNQRRLQSKLITCDVATARRSYRQKRHVVRRILCGNTSILLRYKNIVNDEGAWLPSISRWPRATKIHNQASGQQKHGDLQTHGQVLQQMSTQITMLEEVEETTEFLIDQASDLMIVSLANMKVLRQE